MAISKVSPETATPIQGRKHCVWLLSTTAVSSSYDWDCLAFKVKNIDYIALYRKNC